MDRSDGNSSPYILEQNAALIGICFIFQRFIFVQDRQLLFLISNLAVKMLQPVFQTFLWEDNRVGQYITEIKRSLGQQTEKIGQCNAVVILFHSCTKSTLF